MPAAVSAGEIGEPHQLWDHADQLAGTIATEDTRDVIAGAESMTL
jgi:hypothetical protein